MSKLLPLTLALLSSPVAAEVVVLEGAPTSMVLSGSESTTRTELSSTQRDKHPLRITKTESGYVWASKSNRTLHYARSGMIHTFTALDGSGYVAVLDHTLIKMEKDSDSFEYMEHIRGDMAGATFFGEANAFSP